MMAIRQAFRATFSTAILSSETSSPGTSFPGTSFPGTSFPGTSSPGATPAAVGLVVLGLVAQLALGGCARPGEESPAPATVATAALSSEAVVEQPPLNAAQLAPVMRPTGVIGVAPSKLVIELARPVIAAEKVHQPVEDRTILKIEPEVAGELRYAGRSTVVFLPKAGFAPGTSYSAVLESVETSSGVVAAPAGEAGTAWRHRFTVPYFAFNRAFLGDVDLANQRAEIDLVFAGAIDSNRLQRYLSISVRAADGTSDYKPRLRVLGGHDANVAKVLINSSRISAGARLDWRLAKGVPSRADRKKSAGPGSGTFTLGREARVEIKEIYPAEGPNGFYLQVICDDLSLSDRRSYYDRASSRYYRRISKRCLPDDSAVQRFHFQPDVGPISIASSGGGFRIFSDFSRGSYSLRLDAGMQTQDGGVLISPHQAELTVPSRSPSLRFVTQGRYLPRSAWSSLPLRHLNVRRALLTVHHVPPENLVFWMSDEDDEAANERTGNLIVRQEIDLSGEPDEEQSIYLSLSDLVPPEIQGMIEIRIAGDDAEDSARLLLTDLQLVAKRAGGKDAGGADDELHVWALDSETIRPQRGVEVKWVRKSGFVVASCRTGSDGGCRLVRDAEDIDPSEPFALIARKGGDLTYLRFSDLRAEVQEARVSGDPYGAAEAKYRVAPYSDRGVYRPGETAHLAAIVRQGESQRAPQAGMPVEVELLDPRGRVVQRHSLETNSAGYLELDAELPAFADTGRYEARYAVGERQVGQLAFQVEEFVPERMEVTAESVERDYLLGDELGLSLAARYLFGGVPAGHRVEVSCELVPATFSPAENGNFEYGIWTPEEEPPRAVALGAVSGTLDDEGGGRFACPSPAPGRRIGLRGPAKLIGRAAVFEAGSGRTSVGRAEAPVHPERFYLGLNSSAGKVEAGNDWVVDGITVDWQGRRVTGVGEVEVELLRLETEWGLYWDESTGRESYRRYLRPVSEDRRNVVVKDGRFQVTWRPSRNAKAFLVRATAGAARTDLRVEGGRDWYYWAPRQSRIEQTPRPGQATWIEIEGPGEKVRVGKPFEVTFTAPYRGRVLMTAETDHLLASRWIDVDDPGEMSWRFELDELVPNLYVTAFMVKDPALDGADSFLPDRAFGVTSLSVEPEALTQTLTLSVPEEVRSGSRLEVEIDVGKSGRRKADAGPTFLTVAAVDEGGLSLTGFASPDPLAAIFARRALGVETFETIGWTVVVPPADPTSATGGDTTGSLGRIDGIKPVALWSGLVEVPASGKVKVSFDLPQYRGALRLMAVSAASQRIGHAERRVIVRDPLVVEATLPRFLTAGDEVAVPVHLTNLSGRAREVTVSLASSELKGIGLAVQEGAPASVEVLGAAEKSIFLEEGAAGTLLFRARAARPTGASTLAVHARSGDLSSRQEVVVPVLPTGAKSRRVQRVKIEAGVTDLAPYLRGWTPLSERTSVWVTSNPYGDAFDHLNYLVRYPYGCLEQTTSSSRPLLWVGKLLSAIDPEILAKGSIEERVMRGVERLMTMQTPSGGFAYWQGGTQEAYWATAYATHFLLEARDQRYPVAEERIDEALAWMARQINGRYVSNQVDYYSRDGEPYMHYVLALAGRSNKARIRELIEQLRSSDQPQRGERRENLYLLKAALYLAGDQRYEADLKRPDLSPLSEYRSTGWSFYSDRRMRGLMLSTYIDLFGAGNEGDGPARLAGLVAESLRGKRSRWYTTQELVWSVTGLGKLVQEGASDFAPAILKAAGRTLAAEERAPGSTSNDRVWEVVRASEYGELTVELLSKGEGAVWAILSTEGVRSDEPAATGGEGLRLRRRWLDAEGEELPLADGARRMKLGSPVFVELSLTNTSLEQLTNVALVDRLPAGWEIENPRLGRGGSDGFEWLAPVELWQTDQMNLRDDRLEVFGSLGRGQTVKVVYGVRAVSAGDFRIPNAEAEAMYDPRIWAREAGGRVVVSGPWLEALP